MDTLYNSCTRATRGCILSIVGNSQTADTKSGIGAENLGLSIYQLCIILLKIYTDLYFKSDVYEFMNTSRFC